MRARVLLLLPLCLGAQPAGASPAFTRQMGAACDICHFQDMRSLNAYGREFLLNSFHESARMVEERRQREEKVRQESDKRNTQPLEKVKGHPEDSGRIEEDAGHEALESPEEESIEEQPKNASP